MEYSPFCLRSGIIVIWVTYYFSIFGNGYKIGVGIADVTGPAAEVIFMGYGSIDQKGSGIHLRQFSRAYIIADEGKNKLVFVNVDIGMIGNGLRQEVLRRLNTTFGSQYNVDNVMISGIHTHSAPGGYLLDFLFDLPCLGFIPDTFQALAEGIVLSIEKADRNLKEGRIFISKGTVLNANINRSPTAYVENPESERAMYEHDVDKTMVLLKFVDKHGGGIGMLSWFAVHPTSMNKTNRLISSDNIGYASVLFEKAMNPPGTLVGKGTFIGSFAASNLGDVSPNIRGPRCESTEDICDAHTSKCSNGDFCVGRGPGKNMLTSTKIIAERIATKAVELWKSNVNCREITGKIRTVHEFVHMPSETVDYVDMESGKVIKGRGCLPAMGHSFAAGTTDGPGLSVFMQGNTEGTDGPLWSKVPVSLVPPSAEQIDCHGKKPILINTGEMQLPYEWQPQTVSTQLATLGDEIAIACVPGEFTTMSGRRLRRTIKNELKLNREDDVIIAGLCNTYSDYVTTPEEYQVQRYEGASTVYGPHTLPIYLKRYRNLASIIKGYRKRETKKFLQPVPDDIFNKVLTLQPPVMFDTPKWGYNFGDCIVQPPSVVNIGHTVTVRFVSGHPRNNLRHESTFLTVERFEGGKNWSVVATDADWETQFIWQRTSLLLGKSEVEIRWHIGSDVKPGYYRIRHFGHYKHVYKNIIPYHGVTQVFRVTY